MCIHKEAMIWKLLAVAGWNDRRSMPGYKALVTKACAGMQWKKSYRVSADSTLWSTTAEQHAQENLEDLTEAQLLRTFQSNVFSMVPHEGGPTLAQEGRPRYQHCFGHSLAR
jgi:hypothetical protein